MRDTLIVRIDQIRGDVDEAFLRLGLNPHLNDVDTALIASASRKLNDLIYDLKEDPWQALHP